MRQTRTLTPRSDTSSEDRQQAANFVKLDQVPLINYSGGYVSPEVLNFVKLDQIHICFDVDQKANSKQELKLSRRNDVCKDIAWRMRTNEPTGYIVNPSRGIIRDDNPITLSVELVENKFHPSHKLILQAMELIDGCNEKTIWKHENAKIWSNVQTIQLKLSTMSMNIETFKYEEENAKKLAENVKNLMQYSPTIGIGRIRELENLLNVLQADTKHFKKNIERTIRLKAVLERALESRKTSMVELKRLVMETERKTKKLKKELADKETELQQIQKAQTSSLEQPTCRVT